MPVTQRPLGKTGVSVSSVGFGAWAIGGTMWGGADESVSRETLARALDAGVTLFDTALVYGMGLSERLVGRAIAPHRDRVVLCTKVPPLDRRWPAAHDAALETVFPAQHIVSSCEASLKNLGLETIDLLQLHVWSPAWARQDGWREAMARLRKDGKIRFVGISINDHEPDTALEVVRDGHVDAVQVIFNLFDQAPAERLLPACAEHGVGVLARVPFDEGSLTGKLRGDTRFAEGDFRARYFAGERLAETVARVEALRWLEKPGRTLAQAALGFVLSHPAVSSVIPGMRTIKQVDENAAAATSGLLSDDERRRAATHRWDRNFYAF